MIFYAWNQISNEFTFMYFLDYKLTNIIGMDLQFLFLPMYFFSKLPIPTKMINILNELVAKNFHNPRCKHFHPKLSVEFGTNIAYCNIML